MVVASIAKRIFGSANDRRIKRYQSKVDAINALEPEFAKLSDDELRQKMIQEGVQKVVAKARASVAVEKFNLDGSPARATDQAQPPPAR